MSPALLLLIAILSPLVLATLLLAPLYGGMLGAAYVVYWPESGTHPLDTQLLNVFYVIDVYAQLFDYWSQHTTDVSFLHYTLPVLGLPALGIIIAFYSTYRFVGALRNLFHMVS